MQISDAKIQNNLRFNISWVKKILTIPAVWWQRSIMRHQLGELPAYRLEDMGISEEEAFAESQKPFWAK